MTRQPVLTQRVVDDLAMAISLGATYDLACKYAGISYDTFADWRKGKLPRSVEPEIKARFVQVTTRAEGQAAVKWLAKIEQAANEDWRAAAWKLERRHPHDYGKSVVENQHTGKDGGPLEILGIEVPRPKGAD